MRGRAVRVLVGMPQNDGRRIRLRRAIGGRASYQAWKRCP